MGVDFFISRAGPDAAWAKWIGDCLIAANYTVVMQDWDFSPGQDFVAEMDRAMRNSERTIAVLSRAYDKALYTVPEWTNAIGRDPTGRQALLIPVLVDDIVPEGIFQTRVYIKLVGLEEARAKQALLDGVSRAAKPRGSNPFPGGITSRFPGTLPPLWRLPSDRNPVFVGREQELAQITAKFESADPPPLIVALIGLGAVGKTALAVEYAYRFSQLYKVVWWLRADRQETLVADLALLAEQLGLVQEEDPLNVRAAAARDWLAAHDRWLLILDDAADPVVARIAIPQGGGGHVLVTSRVPAWRRHAAVLELASLPEEQATDLLARRSGHPRDDASTRLVRALGGLPLAIELAGAFLEQQGIGAEEYVRRLQRSGGLPADDAAQHPPDYHVALSGVWAESFRVLAAQAPEATNLLRLAAFLAPDDIPRPALVKGAHSLPATLASVAVDPDALADLVARPRALSLVSTSGDGFSIHRIVQAVIRQGLANAERNAWAGAAVLLVVHVLPKQLTDFRLWERTGRLLGHALSAAEFGVEYSVEPAATTVLLDRAATFLDDTQGDPKEIEARRVAALRLGESMSEGPPGWLLNNHAMWLVKQKKLDEAEPMFERALRVMRGAEGGDAPAVGVAWANLGSLAKTRGQLERARTCFERSLAIFGGPPLLAEQRRATTHSLLGQVLFEQGERDVAAVHFLAAVRGYDATVGPGSLDAVMARSFLAQARGDDQSTAIAAYHVTPATVDAEQGRVLANEPVYGDEAEALLRRAVEADEPGAAVELSSLLRGQPGREQEGATILLQAAEKGDRQALYWYARELAGHIGAEAEPAIRQSIDAGNVHSEYDLGLVLAALQDRWPEAESAFRLAIADGYEEARNDLGILLCEWPGREREGETELAEAGRRGQARSWFNLAQHLWSIPERREEAITPLRFAANGGYLVAHGTLAYRLEELGRLKEALAAFKDGLESGDQKLQAHLADFLGRHPNVS